MTIPLIRQQREFGLASVLVLLIAIATGCAAQTDLRCPSSVEVSSTVSAVPDGWQAVQTTGVELHPLRAVAFTDGHPRERAFLRPTLSRDGEKTGQRTDVYEFSAASPGGIWMVCQYQETRQVVVRPIKAGRCEVHTSGKPGNPITSIACL